MVRLFIVPVFALALASSCTPIPQQNASEFDNSCRFVANTSTPGLHMACTVEGNPENRRINPLSGDAGCHMETLSLHDQALRAETIFIYGEHGEEDSSKVRIGVDLTNGTHQGRIAKTIGTGCTQTTGPVVKVDSHFSGHYSAMIDRMQTPMCVYRSRFAPDTLTQTVTAGLSVNVTEVTREATLDEITRTLDYEAARAVNRLLTPQVALGGDFARRDGRCADGRDENI